MNIQSNPIKIHGAHEDAAQRYDRQPDPAPREVRGQVEPPRAEVHVRPRPGAWTQLTIKFKAPPMPPTPTIGFH